MTEFETTDKLWRLWEIACQHLRSCEDRDDVTVEMASWYRGCGETCVVCMAGAVMLEVFKLNMHGELLCGHEPFTVSQWDRFKAINSLRQGRVLEAHGHFTDWSKYYPDTLQDQESISYKRDGFWLFARTMLAYLKKEDI